MDDDDHDTNIAVELVSLTAATPTSSSLAVVADENGNEEEEDTPEFVTGNGNNLEMEYLSGERNGGGREGRM